MSLESIKTYKLHSGHLGDCWSYMNFLLYKNPQGVIRCTSPNPDRVEFYKRIYNLLNSDTKVIFEVGSDYDYSYSKSKQMVEFKFLSTKIKYRAGNYICYSFDANWIVDKKIPQNVDEILKHKSFCDIQKIKCSLPLSIEDDVYLLANCKLYVGVDNGISHIAKSVGCPMLLIEHIHPLEDGFPSKYNNYIKAIGVNDAINKMQEFLK